MKVLFIIDTLETGGAEKSLLDITSRFSHFEPVFLQLFPGEKLANSFQEAGIEVHSFKFSTNYNFKRIANEIVETVKKINPVIIHSTLFRSDMVARELVKQIKVPLINSFVNNSYSKNRYNNLDVLEKIKLKGIEFWDRYTAKNVDLFISNSETIKKSNAVALKIPHEKITVIYRGRDSDKFSNIEEQKINALKQELNIQNEKVFLNVSRLLERKGQLELIKAFNGLIKKHPDSKLLIAGEGVFHEDLEKEIKERSLQESVTLLGNRDDVPVLLKLADFFVFPSHYEGLPGALIEAMFSKTTIIASDIPENMECVDTTKAYVFPVGNIPALTTSLIKAIELNSNGYSDKAYKYALQNFQIDEIVRKYESVYKGLLNK